MIGEIEVKSVRPSRLASLASMPMIAMIKLLIKDLEKEIGRPLSLLERWK